MHSRSCRSSASKCFRMPGPQRRAMRRTRWCSLRQFNLGEREREKKLGLWLMAFLHCGPARTLSGFAFFSFYAALSSRSVNTERLAKRRMGLCKDAVATKQCHRALFRLPLRCKYIGDRHPANPSGLLTTSLHLIFGSLEWKAVPKLQRPWDWGLTHLWINGQNPVWVYSQSNWRPTCSVVVVVFCCT